MNVLNLTDIERNLKKVAVRAAYPEAYNWVMSVARNYILNPEGTDALVEFTDYDPRPPRKGRSRAMPPRENLPDWANKALEARTPVHFFKPVIPKNRSFWQRLELVVDWINAWEPSDPTLSRIDRMSWQQAVELSQTWMTQISENPWKHVKERELETVMEFDDGYRWVKLLHEKHLQREGQLMKHCVGSGGYVANMLNRQAVFFSLRDDENVPHITMQATQASPGAQIVGCQIKGKTNQKPQPQYQPYLKKFIEKFKIKIAGDSHMID